MTCTTCGRTLRHHGSQEAIASGHPRARETYAMESGCHDGVWMDDDVHGEGWEPDVIYPPCPFNPRACDCLPKPNNMSFGDWQQISYGTGLAQDDCQKCNGTGWMNGTWEYPVSVDELNSIE